jgi:hypothetical protein
VMRGQREHELRAMKRQLEEDFEREISKARCLCSRKAHTL